MKAQKILGGNHSTRGTKAIHKTPVRAIFYNELKDDWDAHITSDGVAKFDTIGEYTSGNGVVVDGVLIKDGQMVNNTQGFPLYHGIDPESWITYFDDYVNVAIDDIAGGSTGFAVQTDAIGTSGVEDGAGGWLEINATDTDNNETYFSSATEAFTFETDKKLIFKCKVKLTEANTDDANWIIGLSNQVGANTLQDDGAGPPATYDGAVFFKVDGTMKIQFETSNAGTQVTNATLADFVSASTYTLAMIYDYGDGTTGTVTPYVNGTAGTAHNITIAGLEEMHIVAGVKAGDTNAESLLVDYIGISQERP